LEDDMRILKRTGLLLLAHAFLVPLAHAQTPLTEARVVAIFHEMESAVRGKDVSGVVRHFAPDAIIRLVMPRSAGGQILELSVAEYAKMLGDGWAMAAESTYAVEDIAIEISADGRSAEVSDTTVETMKVQGRTISARTRERFSVESRGGRLVITRLTGQVEM
jgi:ketosteroid isomerase-like protein